MKKILIGGGSGLVGHRLSHQLKAKGYKVCVLSRNPTKIKGFLAYRWDLDSMDIDPLAVKDAYGIINLTGAGIADKRWTAARKEEIINSRLKSIELLERAIQINNDAPKVFINASAIGIYGDRGDELLNESSSPGEGFMADCCRQWEEALTVFKDKEMRLTILRIGIVLSQKGGALSKMLMPLNFGVGSYFGSGKQYYSWIHIDDLVNIFIKAIENEQFKGVYNAVAPSPITNYDFVKTIKTALGKIGILAPAPEFVMRLAMGEMANVVLNSNRVIPERLNNQNFEFKFENLSFAVKDLAKRHI